MMKFTRLTLALLAAGLAGAQTQLAGLPSPTQARTPAQDAAPAA
jgi:hypothetical protein